MWAIIEDNQITRIEHGSIQIRVPGEPEPVPNLASLTLEDRKRLGVYKVIVPEAVDARYYAATYTKNVIDHEKAQVRQENEIVAQPIERIVEFKLAEVREIRDRWENNTIMINVDRPLEGGWVTLGFKPTARLQARLALDRHQGWMVHDFIEDVNGKIHRLVTFELRDLAEAVSLHLCQVNKAAYEAEMILKAWPEEEADALIELNLEEMIQGRYQDDVLQHISDLKRWVKEKFIDP